MVTLPSSIADDLHYFIIFSNLCTFFLAIFLFVRLVDFVIDFFNKHFSKHMEENL